MMKGRGRKEDGGRSFEKEVLVVLAVGRWEGVV